MSRSLQDYEGFWGATQLQLDMYNPLNVVRLIEEGPDEVDLFSAVYHGLITLGGLKLVSWVTGEPITKVNYLMHSLDMKARQARGGLALAGRGATVGAVLAVPTAISVAGTLAYEQHVNKPLRRSHGGTQGTWFGPHASGFGTVV